MNFAQTPVTFIIIAINILFSIAGFYNDDVINKNVFWPYGIKRRNQYWRFITAGFLHASWQHLFFNMFTFYFFGRTVEYVFNAGQLGGAVSVVLLYIVALVGSIVTSYVKQQDNPSYTSLGASGAVSAFVFAAVLFDPWAKFYFIIPAIVFAIIYIWYCVYMSRQNADRINHDAHLWGSLIGVGFTLILVAVKNPALFDFMLSQLTHPRFR